MKTCKWCKITQSTSNFYKHKTNRDRLESSCKECKRMKLRDWRGCNMEHVSTYNKTYYRANKTIEQERKKHYNVCNREAINRKRNETRPIKQQQRYRSDLNFRLAHSLRGRLYQAIKHPLHKVGSAIQDLGCSVSELKAHLESLFQPGMSWANWSKNGWHIDHIIPLSSFDLTDPEQLKKACHYTNLQPLWAKDNLKKGDRL